MMGLAIRYSHHHDRAAGEELPLLVHSYLLP